MPVKNGDALDSRAQTDLLSAEDRVEPRHGVKTDWKRKALELAGEHQKAHHALDTLGAPVLDAGDNPLTLSGRIEAYAARLCAQSKPLTPST